MPFPDVRIVDEPFNVSEIMITPVPYSVYSKQDWCQTWIWEKENEAAWHDDTTTSPVCPRSSAYNPIIFLPSDILQSLDPLWATCTGDVRGNYDPPTALQPATNIAKPSTLAPVATTPAAPSSQLASPTPSATAVLTVQMTSSCSPLTRTSSAEQATVTASNESPAGTVSFTLPEDQIPSSLTQASLQSASGSQDPVGEAPNQSAATESMTHEPADPSINSALTVGEASTQTTAAPDRSNSANGVDFAPVQTSTNVWSNSPLLSSGVQLASSVQIPGDPTVAEPVTSASTVVSGLSTGPIAPFISAIGQLVSSAGQSGPTPQTSMASSNPDAAPDQTTRAAASFNTNVSPMPTDSSHTNADPGMQGSGFSIVVIASSIIFGGVSTTTAIALGQDATIQGITVNAAGTDAVAVDSVMTVSLSQSSALYLPVNPESSVGASTSTVAVSHQASDGTAVMTNGGSTTLVLEGSSAAVTAAEPARSKSALNVAEQSGDLVLSEGIQTTTLRAGMQATFDGHTVGVLQSGSIVNVDGSAFTASSSMATLPPVETGSLGLTQAPSGIVAEEDGSSVTLNPGEYTAFADHSISAARSGGAVLIDGRTTRLAASGSVISQPTTTTVLPSGARDSSGSGLSPSTTSGGARVAFASARNLTCLAASLLLALWSIAL